MKVVRAIQARVGISAVFLVNELGACETNTPAFASRAFIGENYVIGLAPKSPGWISVETSFDLFTWRHAASVASTNGVTVYVDTEAKSAPVRFYRLKQPGLSTEEAEAKWSIYAGIDYQFQLEHVRLPGEPYVEIATVTVSKGQKTISDAQANGQPINRPNPDDFPNVEELFKILRQTQQSGCWRVAVMYDEFRGYPVWCVIERLTEGVVPNKQIDQYRITELTTNGGSE